MSELRWVDNHCHLPDDDREVERVIGAARSAGVTALVNVGVDAPSSRRALDLAERYDGVYATVGLHPHDAAQGVDTVRELMSWPGVRAVGEAGLDYHYDHSPRDEQRRVLEEQVVLAHELDLPLVVHSREAWDDTFAILDQAGWPRRTVLHCFTGGPAEAERCLESGGYLSFSGIVTFKNAGDVRAAAALCPLDRLLVETDSPYLAPAPYRGRRNEPAWVAVVGEAVAALRGVATEVVASATSATACEVFALDV